MTLTERLQQHVSGAIARGEGVATVEQPAAHVTGHLTDAEIRQAIRVLRADLLRRQQERASAKYLTKGGR